MTVEHHRSLSRFLGKSGLQLALGLIAFAHLALSTAPASAQSASDSATAQALFDSAKALMSAGKYSEACPVLEESQRIEARSGTLLNLAACYEQVGRLASAWSTFLEAATLAKATGNIEREQGARERAAALVPRLSKLTIGAPSATVTPGLEIRRDGKLIGAAQLGLALPADAGAHTVSVRAPGRKPWRTTVTVQSGASIAQVNVPDLERETAVPPAIEVVPVQAMPPQTASAPPAAVEPARAENAPARIRTEVIVGGAVTGAFAVGTVVTAVLYGNKMHEYNTANDSFASNAADLRSQVKTLGVTNLVLLGGTAIAAGVTIYLWKRPRSQEGGDACLELRTVVGAEQIGLNLGGRL